MEGLKPVFIADSCVGGLSVLKSLWNSGSASDAVFLADYEINPLGLKSDSAIEDVVERWLGLAEERSNTLVVACNTLSIRYQQLLRSNAPNPRLKHIVSMVDCFKMMAKIEADRLANRNVLIIGTEFTASQHLYPDILSAASPGVQISTVAATNLERQIARFQPWKSGVNSALSGDLKEAIKNTDIAVLACTCFPMVGAELESLYPEVIFLDPGAYCSSLLKKSAAPQNRQLTIEVTGKVVSTSRVNEFAKSYLNNGTIVS